MPRTARKQSKTGVYHIMLRGYKSHTENTHAFPAHRIDEYLLQCGTKCVILKMQDRLRDGLLLRVRHLEHNRQSLSTQNCTMSAYTKLRFFQTALSCIFI